MEPTVATVCSWPGPDVRERQLFGVSMRTAGFRQGNRKLEYPQSTHCSRSDLKEAVARGLTGRPGDMACLCHLLSSLAPATAVPRSVDCWPTGSCLRTPIFQAHDGMGGAPRGRHVASKCGVDTADQLSAKSSARTQAATASPEHRRRA